MTQPLDVHAYLFETYAQTLVSLGGNASISIALRKFEAALLQECGYLPDLTSDGETGEPLDPKRFYELRPERGLVLVRDEPLGREHDRIWSGATLTAIYTGDFRDRAVREAARRIFQAALRPHLGDRPLASRELLHPANSTGALRS